MEDKHTGNDQLGIPGRANDVERILLVSPDIMWWELPEEFLLNYGTGVAGFTEDVSRFFYPISDQDQLFGALGNLIYQQIDNFQAERGIKSVVSIGDKDKIMKALNPGILYLYDKSTRVLSLSFCPVDLHALMGKFNSLRKGNVAFLLPVRTFSWPGDWKNIVVLTFDIRRMQHSNTSQYNIFFGQAMHELTHHAEHEHMLHKTDDRRYTAYMERNSTFWDYQLIEVYNIVRSEETLMDDGRELDWPPALEDLLDSFLNMKKWEAGQAVSMIPGIGKERYQIWLPDHAQLYALMGIKMRLRDILEHYASGACGKRLEFAANEINRFFNWCDDYPQERRRVALQFAKAQRMSEQEEKEHMQMVESSWKRLRQAREEEFRKTYRAFRRYEWT